MPAILPTMVTSSPSRIQVIPSAAITSQCQRAHGRRSILVGMRLSTAPCAAEAPSLTYASPSLDRIRLLARLFHGGGAFTLLGLRLIFLESRVMFSALWRIKVWPVCLSLWRGINERHASGQWREQCWATQAS